MPMNKAGEWLLKELVMNNKYPIIVENDVLFNSDDVQRFIEEQVGKELVNLLLIPYKEEVVQLKTIKTEITAMQSEIETLCSYCSDIKTEITAMQTLLAGRTEKTKLLASLKTINSILSNVNI